MRTQAGGGLWRPRRNRPADTLTSDFQPPERSEVTFPSLAPCRPPPSGCRGFPLTQPHPGPPQKPGTGCGRSTGAWPCSRVQLWPPKAPATEAALPLPRLTPLPWVRTSLRSPQPPGCATCGLRQAHGAQGPHTHTLQAWGVRRKKVLYHLEASGKADEEAIAWVGRWNRAMSCHSRQMALESAPCLGLEDGAGHRAVAEYGARGAML